MPIEIAMKLDDPFPIHHFSKSVRDSIQAEFLGRCPSIREILNIPDRYWLKVPGIGPATLLKIHRLVRLPGMLDSYSVGEWTDAELLDEYDHLNVQHGQLRRELDDLRLRLKLIVTELRLRGIHTPQNGSDGT